MQPQFLESYVIQAAKCHCSQTVVCSLPINNLRVVHYFLLSWKCFAHLILAGPLLTIIAPQLLQYCSPNNQFLTHNIQPISVTLIYNSDTISVPSRHNSHSSMRVCPYLLEYPSKTVGQQDSGTVILQDSNTVGHYKTVYQLTLRRDYVVVTKNLLFWLHE